MKFKAGDKVRWTQKMLEFCVSRLGGFHVPEISRMEGVIEKDYRGTSRVPIRWPTGQLEIAFEDDLEISS